MYSVEFTETAIKDMLEMEKSNPQAYKKIEKFITELEEHPYTGTGHPHQLRYVEGVWSRSIDKKNRLRYTVDDEKVIVCVISAKGHYDDK